MAAEFVALADLLRAPGVRAEAGDAAMTGVDVSKSAMERREAVGVPARAPHAAEVGAAVRDARLFRARLADALDEAAARLLRELASDVLARELHLAPCDLTELVRRACERAPVVRVRVAACDLARIANVPTPRGGEVQVVEDSTLSGGDVVVELADGALDARLGVRLATVLEAFA